MPEKKKMSEKKDKRRRGKVTIPGVEKPVYVSGKTQKEVEENKRKAREEYILGVRVKDRPFVELIVDWFNTVKKPKIKTSSTMNNWKTTINHHVLPCFNPKKLTSAVSRKDLQQCLDKLEGMNMTVAIQALSTLRGACQLALAEGIIVRDPSILLNKPRPKTVESKDSLSIEQEETLLDEAARSEFGTLLYLLYYTACRSRVNGMRESLRPVPSSRRSICRSAAREPVPVASVWGCQGAMILRGKLFEYCSDDAPIFGRYERCHLFQNSDLFGALAVSLRGREGILPAYHMNKERWVSVLLDGSVPLALALALMDMSFEATLGVRRRVRAERNLDIP